MPAVVHAGETLDSIYETQAKNCESLPCIREEIDSINDKLLALIVRRTAFVRRAGDLKKHSKIANDQKRVEDQLSVISEKSSKFGLPKEISLETFKALINKSIEFEQKYIDRNKG